MNERRDIVRGVVAVAVLLLLAWLTWEQRGRAQRADRELAGVKAELARTQERLTRARAAGKNDEGDRKTMPEKAAAAARQGAATVKSPTAGTSAGTASRTRPWLSRVFAEHPHVHALYLDAYRKDLEMRQGLTLRAIGLSEEETMRVVEVLARDMERASDIAAATRARGMSSVDQPIKELTAERVRERDAGLEAIFGADRYAEWKHAPGPDTPSQVLRETIGALYATTTPLSFAQTRELRGILAGPEGLGWRVEDGRMVAPTEKDEERVVARAGAILSAEQVAKLKELLDARRAREELQRLGRRR